MLTPYRYALWLVLTSCLLVCGCGTAKELGKTLGELAVVRAELIKKFGEQDVNIRVNTFQNQTSISVAYVNSPLNQKDYGRTCKTGPGNRRNCQAALSLD